MLEVAVDERNAVRDAIASNRVIKARHYWVYSGRGWHGKGMEKPYYVMFVVHKQNADLNHPPATLAELEWFAFKFRSNTTQDKIAIVVPYCG